MIRKYHNSKARMCEIKSHRKWFRVPGQGGGGGEGAGVRADVRVPARSADVRPPGAGAKFNRNFLA